MGLKELCEHYGVDQSEVIDGSCDEVRGKDISVLKVLHVPANVVMKATLLTIEARREVRTEQRNELYDTLIGQTQVWHNFLVRDQSGRHLDYPAYTEDQANALVHYFSENDPASRCYIVPMQQSSSPSSVCSDQS